MFLAPLARARLARLQTSVPRAAVNDPLPVLFALGAIALCIYGNLLTSLHPERARLRSIVWIAAALIGLVAVVAFLT